MMLPVLELPDAAADRDPVWLRTLIRFNLARTRGHYMAALGAPMLFRLPGRP